MEDSSYYGLKLDAYFSPLGLESYPFLVGWYNSKVDDKFKLDFPDEALAFVVLSQPSMFERAFLPFLMKSKPGAFQRDPVDECMLRLFEGVKSIFSTATKVDISHDFQLRPNRRPKVLVQTAAHVSGAVRFFQKADVTDFSLLDGISSPRIYPVCIHPRFGGWFAIRGVLVFEEVMEPGLQPLQCPVSLGQEDIARLLKLYNDQWQDWSFRDIMPSQEQYSVVQKLYFSAKPADRFPIIKTFCSTVPGSNVQSVV